MPSNDVESKKCEDGMRKITLLLLVGHKSKEIKDRFLRLLVPAIGRTHSFIYIYTHYYMLPNKIRGFRRINTQGKRVLTA